MHKMYCLRAPISIIILSDDRSVPTETLKQVYQWAAAAAAAMCIYSSSTSSLPQPEHIVSCGVRVPQVSLSFHPSRSLLHLSESLFLLLDFINGHSSRD